MTFSILGPSALMMVLAREVALMRPAIMLRTVHANSRKPEIPRARRPPRPTRHIQVHTHPFLYWSAPMQGPMSPSLSTASESESPPSPRSTGTFSESENSTSELDVSSGAESHLETSSSPDDTENVEESQRDASDEDDLMDLNADRGPRGTDPGGDAAALHHALVCGGWWKDVGYSALTVYG